MRKTIIPALVLAALTLAACGGSDDNGDDAGADQTTGSQETPGDDETSGETEHAGGAIADLNTALLAAEDLPEGAQIQPLDISQLSSSMAQMSSMLEDVTYEPADCADTEGASNPLAREGIEGAGMTATVGTASVDVLVNAVYSDASTDDVDAIKAYAERCPSVHVTGTAVGQPIDMTVTNTVADDLAVDADAAVAVDATVASAAMPVAPTRVVYLVDGDYGVMVSANPDSATYDLDALVQTALDKVRAAQG